MQYPQHKNNQHSVLKVGGWWDFSNLTVTLVPIVVYLNVISQKLMQKIKKIKKSGNIQLASVQGSLLRHYQNSLGN